MTTGKRNWEKANRATAASPKAFLTKASVENRLHGRRYKNLRNTDPETTWLIRWQSLTNRLANESVALKSRALAEQALLESS